MEKFYRGVRSITGRRWCSQCHMPTAIKGGEWIPIMDNMRRKWMCEDCIRRAKIRKDSLSE